MLSPCCVFKLNSMLFNIDSCSKRLAAGTFLCHSRSIKSIVLFLHFVVKQLINSCKCNTLSKMYTKTESSFSSSTDVAEPKIDMSLAFYLHDCYSPTQIETLILVTLS